MNSSDSQESANMISLESLDGSSHDFNSSFQDTLSRQYVGCCGVYNFMKNAYFVVLHCGAV